MQNIHAAWLVVAALSCGAIAARAAASMGDVDQIGQEFDPDNITIAAGGTVAFHNQDDVTHNIHVIGADGTDIDEGLQAPGKDILVHFDKAGTYKIRCAIHPSMKMKIIVE